MAVQSLKTIGQKQSGFRVHTSFKNGWWPSWKQDDGRKKKNFRSCPPDPKRTQ